MKIRLWWLAALWLLCTCLVSPASAQSFKPGTPIAVQLLTPLDTGTAAGAGAGTLAAAATGKQEIILRAETPLNFVVAGAAAPPPPAPPVAEAPQPAYRVSTERGERVDAPPAREDSRERESGYR